MRPGTSLAALLPRVWGCSTPNVRAWHIPRSSEPGEEEIPEGCVAVLTPDAPDVLSHVSVRARNMKVRQVAETKRSEAHPRDWCRFQTRLQHTSSPLAGT